MGGGFTRTYLNVKPQEKNVPWLIEGVWFSTWLCKRVQTHMFSFTNQKRWLEEAEAQVSKINSKGLDLFLAEFLWMIFKGWPHRKKVASPGQSSTDRTWWDEFKIFCVNARPNYKTYGVCWTWICPCKRVQPHMFSFTNQKSDLKRPRRRCQK